MRYNHSSAGGRMRGLAVLIMMMLGFLFLVTAGCRSKQDQGPAKLDENPAAVNASAEGEKGDRILIEKHVGELKRGDKDNTPSKPMDDSRPASDKPADRIPSLPVLPEPAPRFPADAPANGGPSGGGAESFGELREALHGLHPNA